MFFLRQALSEPTENFHNFFKQELAQVHDALRLERGLHCVLYWGCGSPSLKRGRRAPQFFAPLCPASIVWKKEVFA